MFLLIMLFIIITIILLKNYVKSIGKKLVYGIIKLSNERRTEYEKNHLLAFRKKWVQLGRYGKNKVSKVFIQIIIIYLSKGKER